MKILPLQTDYNNSFKAKFINDKNGYFRKLWQDAVLDIELANIIDNFAKKNKSHSLEITDVIYNEKKKCNTYTIFNHRNGFRLSVDTANSPGFKLHEILEKISKSQLLSYKNSRTANLYQKLTGQTNNIIDKLYRDK